MKTVGQGMTGKKYKFSFVMPVYNVEAYLEEAVESIIGQTLDFESSCQVIFINDGSSDNSESICLRYKERYPENIIYIKQSNSGVSVARNVGIDHAEGKYISFMDSDDKLSIDTLKSVYEFFEKNYSKIDVVSIKMEFFEAKTGPHPLNYKYTSSRVIDTIKEYSSIQLSGGSSFVKTGAVKGRHYFNPKLRVAEDATFLTELIMERGLYGVVSEPTYYYRKREDNSSALGLSRQDRSWYLDVPKYTYRHLINHSNIKFGYVPRYVQYLLAYDIKGRFTQRVQNTLNETQLIKYKESLEDTLRYISDDIIIEQRDVYSEEKIFILSKKYRRNISDDLSLLNYRCYLRETKVYDYTQDLKVFIEILEISGGSIVIEGTVWALILPGVEFGFLLNDKFIGVEWVRRPKNDKVFLGEVVSEGYGFKFSCRVESGSVIKPTLRFSDGNTKILQYISGRHSRLLDFIGKPYRAVGGYLVCQPDKRSIYIDRHTKLSRLKKELRYILSYIAASRSDKHKPQVSTRSERLGLIPGILHSVIALRIAYFITKPLVSKRKIWIVSDRISEAGDNGEVFYQYASKLAHKNTSIYFTIMRDSKDYVRLKDDSNVIVWGSWRYKLLFLHSDKIISSHANNFVLNAFQDKQRHLRDLLSFDFVFLQHGIIKDDLSGWLNKYSKNIKLFVTSAEKEFNSVVSGDYFYGKSQVALTGLPRYDNLISKPKNKIIIAPTWRRSLVSEVDANTNQYPYSLTFRQSEYYQFYNRLLNDPSLIDALERYDMYIDFYLHPTHSPQLKDFTARDRVTIMIPPYDYASAFREGSMLVTDFSSVAFDFAYMKKPVIYAQFDKDTFYEGHMYTEGYFSYESHGFGPVTYDYESTVSKIIDIVSSGCAMDEKYISRVDDFFAYTDRNNNRRVYDAIRAMERSGG